MPSKTVLVGVTGGIGSGKSTVCRIFSALGAPVYDADSRAKWLMENDNELVKNITNIFGAHAYKGGRLNRKMIAEASFQDKNLLAELNEAVHPRVSKDFEGWIIDNLNNPYLVKEAALLFETGSYKELDMVINVESTYEIRLSRVLKRDSHRSKTDIDAIIKNQLSDSEKKSMADHPIRNDENHFLIDQVLRIHEEIMTIK